MLAEAVVTGLVVDSASTAAAEGYGTVRDRFRADNPVAETFDEELAERIEECAEETDSRALTNLYHQWEAVVAEIDTYQTVFESEREALDWLVAQIDDEIGLSDDDRTALRSTLAEEYSRAAEAFADRVRDDEELREQFQTDVGIELLDRLNRMATRFDQLAYTGPYELYDFPAEREAVIDALLPGEPIPFADRSEVPAEPEPARRFVLGPSGSGKTRILAAFVDRLPADAVSTVIVPQGRFLDQSDAKELARRGFDGDTLLVWEDVHEATTEDTNVVERTLRELAAAIEPEDSLYTLLEARSGRLDAVSETLRADFDNENTLWADYEPLWVGTVAPESLRQMIDDRVERSEVTVSEAARERLV